MGETAYEGWRELCRRRARMWADHMACGQATRTRREGRRQTFPLMRVIHPKFGAETVRAESRTDAILQAAKAWGVDCLKISREAEVWRMGMGAPLPPCGPDNGSPIEESNVR